MNVCEAPIITAEQERQFRKSGYCLVPDLFSENELREIAEFFEEYKNCGANVFDAGSKYAEIDPAKRQVRAMHPHRYSRKAIEWLINSHVASALEVLLGKPALGVQTMYYFKPPGAKGQGMHQDNFYLLAKPATCIAAWTAIDAADLKNGCLWVVPGSHRDPIICPAPNGGNTWLNYGDSHITKFPRNRKPAAVPVPRGTTMFFDGNLIHGSGPNRTRTRSRRTFIGHYIDEASTQVAKFYHPVLTMQGDVLGAMGTPQGGGPCGDGWLGATH